MQCPNCSSEYSEYTDTCKCGYNFRTGQVEKETKQTEEKSYVGKAFLSLALYLFICWLPGLITNIVFLIDSSKVKKQRGISPKGQGCLIALLVAQLLFFPLVFFLGIMASIAIPSFVQARNKAFENTCHNNIRTIAQSVQMYMLDYNTAPGTDIPIYNDIIMPSSGTYNEKCYIRNPLKCPASNAHYGEFVNSEEMDITCPTKPPGQNHGSFIDLD